MYPQSMFWSKNKKNIKIFLLKIFNLQLGKNLYITRACFRNDIATLQDCDFFFLHFFMFSDQASRL